MRRRRLLFQAALDLMAGHRTVACVEVGTARLHPLKYRLADLHGLVAELFLDAVGPVMPRAPLDGLHGGSRNELQYVASLESNVLHAQVTGDVVGDLAQRALEI